MRNAGEEKPIMALTTTDQVGQNTCSFDYYLYIIFPTFILNQCGASSDGSAVVVVWRVLQWMRMYGGPTGYDVGMHAFKPGSEPPKVRAAIPIQCTLLTPCAVYVNVDNTHVCMRL